MSPEDKFQEYWLEVFGKPDKQSVVTSTVGQLYDMVRQAFIAGCGSAEPIINPEWCEEIVTLHRSNSNFWTVSELAKIFQLPEEQVREILNAKQDATGK
jgi:hypothetical protein